MMHFVSYAPLPPTEKKKKKSANTSTKEPKEKMGLTCKPDFKGHAEKKNVV